MDSKPGRPRQFCNRSHRQRYHEWIRRGGSDLNVAQIADRDGHTCGICGGPVDMHVPGLFGPSIDHVVPVSRGGSNEADNLQLAHRICNIRKRDRLDYTAPGIIGEPGEPPLTLF
jgi:5-methylcytosine-specific restriction endonuclease McrA